MSDMRSNALLKEAEKFSADYLDGKSTVSIDEFLNAQLIARSIPAGSWEMSFITDIHKRMNDDMFSLGADGSSAKHYPVADLLREFKSALRGG